MDKKYEVLNVSNFYKEYFASMIITKIPSGSF